MRINLVFAALFVSVSLAQTGKQDAAPSKPDAAKEVVQNSAPDSGSGLTVARAAIAPELEDNEPVKEGDEFGSDVKQLYCFSQIKGAKDSAEIEHRWYWKDDLVFSRPLKIKSANWRTYSIKNIYPYMTGDWMVSIVNTDKEEVLKTLKFTIK